MLSVQLSMLPLTSRLGGAIQAYVWQSRWPTRRMNKALVLPSISIMARYSIFSKLSPVGKTYLPLVILRSWRLKTSMALVV